ncbi:MAG: DUF6502 family protein [Pikeienuella sp.]
MTSDRIRQTMRRVLRPIVRAMIARGLSYPVLTELLKELFVSEAISHFGIAGKRMTDSRISILTGLQRRDIRTIRDAESQDDGPRSMGPIPRVIALWTSDARFAEDGGPLALLRMGENSFETLVLEVGKDVHPRTILDEMLRLGLAEHDADTDRVALTADSLVPSGNEGLLLAYYSANLGDHAEAATQNLMAAPAPGPFFERAVHYNKLSPASVAHLETLARARQMAVLEELNAEALRLQRAERGQPEATERFRCGAFVFRTGRDEEADE